MTCAPSDLLARANAILAESQAVAVEIRLAGQRLFTVGGEIE